MTVVAEIVFGVTFVACVGTLVTLAIAFIGRGLKPMATSNTEIRSGILKAFDAGTYLASVQFTGSLQQFVTGIPTARDIASGEMSAGRKVAVAFFDPSNHKDAVILAVWT